MQGLVASKMFSLYRLTPFSHKKGSDYKVGHLQKSCFAILFFLYICKSIYSSGRNCHIFRAQALAFHRFVQVMENLERHRIFDFSFQAWKVMEF